MPRSSDNKVFDIDAISDRTQQGGSRTPTSIESWFGRDDSIRRAAQMTEDERSRADKLMHRRMLVLIPGFGRISAQKLLTKLVSQYENALTRLENLPEISETKELQSTYEQYFQKAHSIFVDCKRLISHPLARTKDGIRLKESIKERKKQLSALELRAKQLDGDLRDHYHMDQFKTDGGKASK